MNILFRMRSALKNLLHKDRVEQQLDSELQAYVDMAADEKITEGVPASEARRSTLAEIGGMERVKTRQCAIIVRGQVGNSVGRCPLWLAAVAAQSGICGCCRCNAGTLGGSEHCNLLDCECPDAEEPALSGA